MVHYKHKESRRVVRCTLCTPHRWLGNARGRCGKQPRRSTSRRPERADLAMDRPRQRIGFSFASFGVMFLFFGAAAFWPAAGIGAQDLQRPGYPICEVSDEVSSRH
jgi:hypothetical protein